MRAWSLYSPAMSFAAALGMGLVLWVGGSRVLAGAMTLGELIGFIFYLGLFYEPVGRLHGLNQMLQAARAAGERVFDILDTPEERTHEGRTRNLRSPVHGEVVYENVGFSYRPDRAVLKGVDLRARPGEMIALVGPTGAGKSTLVNLLPAFYELTSGRITIDGQDVSGVALASLRVQISVVSGSVSFQHGRENILYGNSRHRRRTHGRGAGGQYHEFVSRLPQGDSRVGERGVKLAWAKNSASALRARC